MSELKEDIAAERDALRAENENLRGQLAAAGARAPYAPAARFQLSEGERSELEAFGVANIRGVRMTTDEVRAKLAETEDQQYVEIADTAVPVPPQPPFREVPRVPGLDHIAPAGQA